MGETNNNEQAPKKSWFKGLKAEFGRIVWPDKQSLLRDTTTVIIASLCLGALIALLDMVMKFGIDFIIL